MHAHKKLTMNVDEYLQRIGFPRTGEITPDVNTLSLIHKCHVLSVPFENLDTHLRGAQYVLQEEKLFDKVVRKRRYACNSYHMRTRTPTRTNAHVHYRGGFCCELNGLLYWAMRTLGYTNNTHLLSSKVARPDGTCT